MGHMLLCSYIHMYTAFSFIRWIFLLIFVTYQRRILFMRFIMIRHCIYQALYIYCICKYVFIWKMFSFKIHWTAFRCYFSLFDLCYTQCFFFTDMSNYLVTFSRSKPQISVNAWKSSNILKCIWMFCRGKQTTGQKKLRQRRGKRR